MVVHIPMRDILGHRHRTHIWNNILASHNTLPTY